MGSKRDIFVTLAALMLSARPASAIITVESFINQIEDIGPCDPAGGGRGKCGFTEVTDLSQLTAFRDSQGAHEMVGMVRFTAERGQIKGLAATGEVPCVNGQAQYDNGDWDVPDRLFTCSELKPGGCMKDGQPLDASISACQLAPDITGRLDSLTCSDFFADGYTKAGPATHACRLSDFDDPNTDHEDYTFFNYLACHPKADCFQADPVGAAGICDEGASGPFGVSAEDILQGATTEDLWIAGAVLAMRLPFGIRLGNTVYPGVMLNGTRQFDFNDSQYSGRMNPEINPSIPNSDEIAWPALVYSYEANHITPTLFELAAGITPDCETLGSDPEPHKAETAVQYGSMRPKICRGQYSGNDAIVMFIPDILGRLTTPDTGSSFLIGEGIFDGQKSDMGDILPMSRDSVENCFKSGVSCKPLFARDGAEPNHCDYDTTACMDIRGAFPTLRASSPFELARFVNYTLQVPFGQTQFTQPNPTLARVTGRRYLAQPTISATPVSFPACEGFNYCYWRDTNANGERDEGERNADGIRYIHIPADNTGAVRLSEPSAGYFQVHNSTPLEKMDGSRSQSFLSCQLPQSDSQGRNVAEGVEFITATPSLKGDCGRVGPPLDWSRGGSLRADISPLDSGLSGEFPSAFLDADAFVYQITRPSHLQAATITLSGFDLLVREDAEFLREGTGCIELACDLQLPVGECMNHEGMVNDDLSGFRHAPQQGGILTTPQDFPYLPIVCLTRGRTVLLYPFLVKSMHFDSAVVITNPTSKAARVHFYLFDEEGANVATNPALGVLGLKDPARLTDEGLVAAFYNEIPPFGMLTNRLFEMEDDPHSRKPYNAMLDNQCEHASGLFPPLDPTPPVGDCQWNPQLGRYWMYAVVEACHNAGYQIVHGEGGFGATPALVDNEVTLEPVDANGRWLKRDHEGKAEAAGFAPKHAWPHHFYNPFADMEARRYQFWHGSGH